MLARAHRSIDELDRGAWNALAGTEVPFLRHEFLAALEHTGCIGPGSGWSPAYVTLHDAQGLAAAAPAFLKTHSFGEFVFDFSWAEAYARSGRNYYPKLTVCVPFTPATGARLLLRPDVASTALRERLAQALEAFASEQQLSSAHALFFGEADREAFAHCGWLLRRDCQFHWSNQGFSDFEQYLSTFTAEKRKKTRRERRRVLEAGIHFETRYGSDIGEALLDTVYAFHRGTFLRHGHEPYLSRAFFSEVARTLQDAIMFKIAIQRGKPVAAAVFFWCQEALYGRYWGASAEHHSLHFEACYHQGIEFCIERGIGRFEPGTQGEHKVARGFVPALTWSAHHIGDARFRSAVRDFLVREAAAVESYASEVGEHVPYRRAP